MPRTKKDFEDKKARLITIALDIFCEKGYEQTTISDLQKAFGLTKGGMYHYFSSKEEILEAVIEQGLKQGIEELRQVLLELPPEDRLIYLLFNNPANAFTSKLIQFVDLEKSSLVTHKLREQNIKLPIPLIQEILADYAATGFYSCNLTDELAEFLSLLAVAMADTGVLPQADSGKQKKRADALIELWKNTVKPPAKHLAELRRNLYRVIELRSSNEHDN